MKALGAALLLTGTVAVATGTVNLSPQIKNTLTTIDVVPTKPQLDSAFGSEQNALSQLAQIATDDALDGDSVAVRLRAIHALAKYCGSPCSTSDVAHQAVSQVIAELSTPDTPTTGSPVLILRAAIETLGSMRVASDVSTLLPLLIHPSRDIRAATARALRDLCNPQAITPLRTRYNDETTDQVKLAISEALRILGQCSTSP